MAGKKQKQHHTQAGLHVCCELALALKSAGKKRNAHGGAGAGNRPGAKEVAPRGAGWCREGAPLCSVWCDGGDLAARLGAVQANCCLEIPCAAATKSASRSLRAYVLNIIYYIALLLAR